MAPPEECDLIMKGGVTSGIVYPPAVLELKDRYRFRSIGGASAGAIAAAVTAAAEYGRDDGGFEKLKRARDEISQPGFLKDLFQPSVETRPLFAVVLDLAGLWTVRARKAARPAWRGLRALGQSLWRGDRPAVLWGWALGAGLGVALALLTTLVFALFTRVLSVPALLSLSLVFGLPLAWLSGLAAAVSHFYRIATEDLPRSLYGLCTGLGEAASTGPKALTNWLDEAIQSIAGRAPDGPALTFSDLRERRINLEMISSNLTHQRPYLLPFDQGIFIFKKEEFETLFPARIVRQLVADAPARGSFALPADHHFLPRGDKLPVLVATRMSLSFPVLIGAVPLYTISEAALRRKVRGQALAVGVADLQRNWFSDGGISSNFPIHFFDRWLPSRPTFGITLTSLPKDAFRPDAPETLQPDYLSLGEEEEGEGEPSEELLASVYLPKANSQVRPEWVPIEGLPAFVYAIFATAQNFRDTTQAMLPSYRERVVQVRLSEEEGGLNLAMGPQTIDLILKKGALAGRTLRDEFRFDQHWWVRFRVLMGQLEGELQGMQKRLREDQGKHEEILRAQRPRSEGGESFPYARAGSWAEEAERRLEKLRALVAGWGEGPFFARDPPRPEPALRVTPRT